MLKCSLCGKGFFEDQELSKHMNECHFCQLSRLEVIDEQGRAYGRWDCSLEFSIQDHGRTLKIFVNEKEGS